MTYKEENIVNIAMRAAELLTAGKIERDDILGHAGLTDTIISLAEEFEKQNGGVDFDAEDRDYWIEIDAFAEEKLLEQYGVEHQRDPEPLDVKVIIDSGVVHAVLKNQAVPLNVEIVDIDEDYEDFNQLDSYRNELYHDPVYRNCDYSVARFDEAPEMEEHMVHVVAVCGNTIGQDIFSGTWDECDQFCRDNNWTFFDENNFRWDMMLDDPREAELPEGYYTAVEHFCELAGADIENGFVRQHGDKLVCCWQNDLCFEDFVAWVHCEAAMGALSLEEYQHIELKHKVTSMEDPGSSPLLNEMKSTLEAYRADKNISSGHSSLSDIIDAASQKASQQNNPKEPQVLENKFER